MSLNIHGIKSGILSFVGNGRNYNVDWSIGISHVTAEKEDNLKPWVLIYEFMDLYETSSVMYS
jgi:hypothetical protein